MTTEQIRGGGSMTVPQMIIPQIIYLDFDGAETQYKNSVLGLNIDVTVEDSGLSPERIATITSLLNEHYVDQNVVFVTERPESGDYSTVFIGKTSDFDKYGNFSGLAETVDSGNKIKNDDAFVNMEATAGNETIVATIIHELEHILLGHRHAGNGIEAYAWVHSVTVSSGVTSTALKLGTAEEENDTQILDVYGIVSSTTVNSSGRLNVASGGVAIDTTVNDNGYVHMTGGTGSGTEILSGGIMFAESASVVTNTIIQYGGSAIIAGKADGVDVGRSGYLLVSSGGLIKNTEVAIYGYNEILSGGTASSTIINGSVENGGGYYPTSQKVQSGGSTCDVTINYGGRLYVSGGYARDVFINSGGSALLNKGSANGIHVYSSGSLLISSAANLSDISVESGGFIDLALQASVKNLDIASGGSFNFAIGSATSFDYTSGGIVFHQGSQLSDMVISKGQGYTVTSGGNVANLTLASGGKLTLRNGVSGSNISVESGGRLSLEVNGKANCVLSGTNESGAFRVSDGRVSNFTIFSGCSLLLTQSGVADNVIISSGGYLVVQRGCSALNVSQLAGGIINAYVYSGDTATVIRGTNSNGVFSLSNGIASNFIVNRGQLYVYSGGQAVQLELKNTGRAYIYGIVNSAEISRNGYLYVFSGATAYNTELQSNGYLYAYSGSVLSDTHINYGGRLVISSSGTASGTHIQSWGSMRVSNGGRSYDDAVYSNGYMYVSSGGSAIRTQVHSYGYVYVSSGGSAIQTQVHSNGYMYAYNGFLTDISVLNGGRAYAYSGTQLTGAVANSGGYLYINAGCTASDIEIQQGGSFCFGVGNGTDIKYQWNGNSYALGNYLSGMEISCGMGFAVSSGGSMNDIVIASGGMLNVQNGGVANNIVQEKDGGISVYIRGGDSTTRISGTNTRGTFELSNGVASGFDVISGTQSIQSGGKAVDTLVSRSGFQYVSSGASASRTILENGMQYIMCGAEVTGTVVSSGARQMLAPYSYWGTESTVITAISDTEVKAGGYQYLHLNSYYYGSNRNFIYNINRTNVESGGRLLLYSLANDGDSCETDVIFSDLSIQCGGTGSFINLAENVSISVTGELYIAGSLEVFGKTDLSQAAVTLDFTKHNSADSAFINDLRNITEVASWTISVSAEQADGVYNIAGYADAFTRSVNLVVDGQNTDSTLNVADAVIRDFVSYTLIAEDSQLRLSVNREANAGLSELAVSASGTAGEKIDFSWHISNTGKKDIAGYTEKIYLVNADDHSQRMLLKTIVHPETEILSSGSGTDHNFSMVWGDNMGYEKNIFMVSLETASGIRDIIEEDNTVLSSEVIAFERQLFITGLQDTITEKSGRIRTVLKRTGTPDQAETVRIALSGNPELFTAPALVSFAAGESEKVVYFEVGDNADYQGSQTLQITASADGYSSYMQSITLLDDEKPALSFELAADEVSEGESWDAFGKITLSHALGHDLKIKLSYDKTQFADIPDYVIINAGETEAGFGLTAKDDKVSEIDKTFNLTASADGVESATASILLKDNDVPGISFSINKSIVAENSGAYALIGTITRTDDTTNYVKVKFSDENNSGLILPSMVTLGTGEKSVNFYIGLKDNILRDGDRNASVKASIYIDSCGCTVLPVSGETQVDFTILDDDGEALGISLNKSNVMENTVRAAKLTITRNTIGGDALTVNLGVSGSSLLKLPETVQFAEGETSVTIDVDTLTDGLNTGNQLATITATATGYAGAVGYLNISDADLPDLAVSDIAVSGNAYAGTQTLVNMTIVNNGFQECADGVYVKLTLSDGTELGSYKISGPFVVGESKQVGFYVNLPEVTGSKTITAVIDPGNMVQELDDSNNRAVSQAFDIKLDYLVTVETTPEILYRKGVITITGKTQKLDAAAVGNLPLEVLLKGPYGEKLLKTTSDADGNYTLRVDTTDLYAGSYSVYAGNLGSYGNAQDKIEIAGLKVNQTQAFVWDIEDKTSVSGSFIISNLSNAALSGVTVKAVNAPGNFQFTVDEAAILDANGKLTINYTVTADGTTEDGGYTLTRGYQKIDFVVETVEGVSAEFSGYFYSNPQEAILTLSETSVSKTLYSGGEYYYEYTITNTGYGDSGIITINMPDTELMKLISSPTIENLAYGESATVTFKVVPANAELNVPYTGSIGINAENADGAAYKFDYTFVSSNKGNISISLSDENTLYCSDKPMLAGATVKVYNAYTNQLVTSGLSDENGNVVFSDLAEGKYIIKYSAEGHDNAQEVVTVRSGETLELDTMLNYSGVTYTWNVRKVELTDTYEIVLSTEFQTNVPAPVVTITGPTEIPELAWGESQLMTFTVTNHGLIAANDFTLNLPELQMGYKWEVLNDQPITIAPNSAQSFNVLLRHGVEQTENDEIDWSVFDEKWQYDENGDAISWTMQFAGQDLCKINKDGSYACLNEDGLYESYDIDGNLTTVTMYEHENSYTYNSSGQLMNISSAEASYSFLYNEQGVLVSIRNDKTGKSIFTQETMQISSGSGLKNELDIAAMKNNVTLYLYSEGKWLEINDGDLASANITNDDTISVVVHGFMSEINDLSSWTTNIAESIVGTNENAKVIGVDWSSWASWTTILTQLMDLINESSTIGFITDETNDLLSNYAGFAPRYISAVAYQAAEYLAGYNVENIIGHSYGAHIGGLLGSRLKNVDTMIGIDPANVVTIEFLPQFFTNITGYNPHGITDLWGCNVSASYVETYKTSTFLGFTTHTYGNYNYLLAESGNYDISSSILNSCAKKLSELTAKMLLRGAATPISWLSNIISAYQIGSRIAKDVANHSIGQNWIAEQIKKNGTVAKWYNEFIDSASSKEWLGIINRNNDDLECVTLDGENNQKWNGYSVSDEDWENVVTEHAKYVDFSVQTEDIKTVYSEFEEKIKLYDCSGTYTVCVPIANLANNATITIDSLEDWQRSQDCSVWVYLTDTAGVEGICVGKAEFAMPANSYTIVPVELNIDSEDLPDSGTAYLYVKAGVNNDGEYIRYDLNEANNTRLIEVDVEKIDCTERLLGRYEIICDGMETRWEEVWLSTPYCCDFGYKTPYTPSDYDYPESPLLPPDKINGGGITVIPGVPTIPTISGDTKHCTPKYIWHPNTASATPDGGLISYAAVLSSSAEEEDSICAHVKMEFAQTAVTSREGFEGTLTLTNNFSEINDITFTAQVWDSNGNDVSDLFQIAENGNDGFRITLDGEKKYLGLGNEESGTFTILYVPGRNTAVNGPEEYQFTGTVSYTAMGQEISFALTPITLTVNSSPALTLHYFVERDVYSDDPFTADVVEKAVPAEISVLVVNRGAGNARNFSLSGFTPTIVENEKGLLIDYNMVDAALNGVKNDNGIADVSFGTIDAKSSAVAQWWYTANVQGHYSDYSVSFEHMDYSYTDLYGNTRYVAADNSRQDLSLIESAEVHELIRSVQADGDSLPDFLVNDLADSAEMADGLYLSDGSYFDVHGIMTADASGSFGTINVAITLTAELAEGWNYLRILDPGSGDYELVSVIRDGVELNSSNFWQTDRYYVDEEGTIMEDRLHLLDQGEVAGSVTYTLNYTAKDKSPLLVTSIAAPDSVVKGAVDSITVVFNKAVNADTFTWADIDLFRQEDLTNNLITEDVTVTRIDDKTFIIGNLTGVTGDNGYYQLLVRTAGIADTVGNSGSDGKAVYWTNAGDSPAITDIPELAKLMNEKTDSITLEFSSAIAPDTLTASLIAINGKALNNVSITAVDETNSRFKVSGIAEALHEGENVISVDVTKITSISGTPGAASYTKNWSIDLTAPEISTGITDMGLTRTAPKQLVFSFSERINTDVSSLTLKRNGETITSDSLSIKIEENNIIVTGIATALSDGQYELVMDLTQVTDDAENHGTGTATQAWTVDTAAPAVITGLALASSCDWGISDTDRITAARELTLIGTLPESGLSVRIYQEQNGVRTLLYNEQPENIELNAVLTAATGNSELVVVLTDGAGNQSESRLSIFVDELAFSVKFAEKFESALEKSPDVITMIFTDEVSALTLNDLTLTRDGKELSLAGCTLEKSAEKTWRLSGISAGANGNYQLKVNLTNLTKELSGLHGSGSQEISWQVYNKTAPEVLSCSIPSNQILEKLSTFSIVFSHSMNCSELIASGAITHAVRIAKTDAAGKFEKMIQLNTDEFQYISSANTLVWQGGDALNEPGHFILVLDSSLLRNADNLGLTGGYSSSEAMVGFTGGTSIAPAGAGYAVPVWCDMNGDGLKDLLIGEKSNDSTGKIRIYLNNGSDSEPLFSDYSYLQGVSGDWSINAAGCLGVAFRMADANGDGEEDLVYGTSDGEILVSVKSGEFFMPGTALTAGGSAIDVGNRAVFELCDWNGDGKTDIISGASDGKVYLYVNNGDWSFAAAETLNIQLSEGWSAVAVADLNGDGNTDIVSGDSKGNLFAFLNNSDGSFASVTLASGSVDRSRPFVSDVNGDGIVDITVGYADGSIQTFYGSRGEFISTAFNINSSPVLSGDITVTQDGYDVTISWSPAVDDGDHLTYMVKVGSTVYNTNDTTLTLKALDADTYDYQIGVCDSFGLETWSSVDQFTVADITAPELSTKLELKQRKNTITLEWGEATDNVGIAGYKFEINGTVYNTSELSYSMKNLAIGSYEYRLCAYDAAGLETWSEKQTFSVTEIADTADHKLVYEMPSASYGSGCVPCSVGMLLGYYDLYGYCGYDVSNLIDGEITVDSRGNAETLLNQFIVSDEYTARFIGKSADEELDATFVIGQDELNTAEWNSLSDWLGTGQYWRGSADYATAYYYGTLGEIKSTGETYTVESKTLPVKYADFKYGLELFVTSCGYDLNDAATQTVKADTLAGGTFTFENLMSELDAGRGVLISLISSDAPGHMVLAYGYNEAAGEIIFDDTVRTDCRMTWDGTYLYGGHDYKIQAVTTIVFDVNSLNLLNQDNVAPVLTVTGNANVWTNENVTLSASAEDNASGIKAVAYTLDGEHWIIGESVTLSENGIVIFRATDNAGNVSTQEIIVDRIDKIAPAISNVTADITTATRTDVWVTASFADDVELASKQYKIDNGEWQNYTDGVTMSANGTVYFKAIDTAGNEALKKYEVTNIDKVAPELIRLERTPDGPTNGDVTVTIQFKDDHRLASLEYSLDEANWTASSGSVTITQNQTVYFRAFDVAGNESRAEYKVTNIDRTPPDLPVISASTSTATNQPITLTALFAGDSIHNEYSLDGNTWNAYQSGVVVGENQTVYFRSFDAAGNESRAEYEVTSIDRTPPDLPVISASTSTTTNLPVTLTAVFAGDSIHNEYSLDGDTWNTYQSGVVVSENQTVYFRSFDAAGNMAKTQYTVVNIDSIPPKYPQIVLSNEKTTREIITVKALFAEDSAKNEFSINGDPFQSYTGEFLLVGNSTLSFRSTDTLGNHSTFNYVVSNILSPDANGPATVTPTATVKKYNATLKWSKAATSDKKVKVANYEIYCNGQYLTSKSTSLTLKNLSVGNYTCFVRAIDSEGRYGAWSAMQTLTVEDVTAPKLGKVTASVDGYTGILSWTGEDNVGIVRYEVHCGDQFQMVTETSARFENLLIGRYNAEVIAFDAAGNASKIAKVKISVKDATPPEQVTGLAIPLVDSKYKATLTWDPAVDNSGKIARYEIQLDDGKILKSSKTSINVSKLSVGEHSYKVRAIDKDKNVGEWSDSQLFTVKDMTAPTSIKAKATVDGYSVLFNLSGKDNSGSIARYVVTCGDKSVETTTDTAVLSDFGVGKQTAFIIAYDAEGNASKEAKVSFNVKDATPPGQVTGLEPPLVDSKYKATLTWDPAVDNSGKIASYEIQLDDGKILKSSKTSINVSKLSVGEHSYKVRAIDKDKNVGEWSDSQSFYVQDMSAPGNVSAKATVEENSLLLSWKTPKDNVGVTGYILKHGVNLENEAFLAAEELNYRIDGIAKGIYQYQITAEDEAGNLSKPKTGKVSIKTELPVEEPVLPEPASLNVFDSGMKLAWASVDDPLAIASNLKLDTEETLSVIELTGQDTTNSNRLQLFTVAS